MSYTILHNGVCTQIITIQSTCLKFFTPNLVQNVREDDDPAVMDITLILYINHVIFCLVDILFLQLKVYFVRMFPRTVI